ncbi:hypothetical protein Misp02_10110 [Microtetraspora sp. NBRC 16547]|nr:hypothetical protein Misp02_10110 [Microtetraspora sp. NBRC 16547]
MQECRIEPGVDEQPYTLMFGDETRVPEIAQSGLTSVAVQVQEESSRDRDLSESAARRAAELQFAADIC